MQAPRRFYKRGRTEHMKKTLKKIWDILLSAEKVVMSVSCIVIVTLVFTTVIMRYFFKANFAGMEEVIIFFAFIIYFIGSAYCSYEESQISADMMGVFIKSERTMELVKVIRGVIESILLVIATGFCVDLVAYAARTGAKTTAVKIPFTLSYSVVLIGVALMTFYTAVHTVRHTKNYIAMAKGVTEE